MRLLLDGKIRAMMIGAVPGGKILGAWSCEKIHVRRDEVVRGRPDVIGPEIWW